MQVDLLQVLGEACDLKTSGRSAACKELLREHGIKCPPRVVCSPVWCDVAATLIVLT